MGDIKKSNTIDLSQEGGSSETWFGTRQLLVLFLAFFAIGVAGTVAEQQQIQPAVDLVSLR